jgi:subtilase family serine protease
MLTTSAFAETATPGKPLLFLKVDDRQTVRLEGNTRPETKTAVDLNAVPESLKLDHILLQLRRSDAQEQAVEAFVNSQKDKSSPNYHRWLTAAQFGQRFGLAQSDIARINDWLRGKGFAIKFVYPSRMVIDFSGTAGQVKQAFHTEIHKLDVAGTMHIANMSDPEIPVALAPAVEGIVSLHDFRPQNKIARRPKDTGSCDGSACWALAPGDLATIYGLTSLFKAGYSGQGEVVAAVEPTNLYNNNDFTTFRKTFQLTNYPQGKLQVVHPAASGGRACGNPGVDAAGDDGEATLDVEWATAAAPSATIMLASCADNGVTDGTTLATQNLVNSDNPPPVISVSYGTCEAENGAAANVSFDQLALLADSIGISIFVATGDNGPTDCAASQNGTPYGIGISGWAASNHVTAVGGTDFRPMFDNTTGTYWKPNAGAPWSTAKSYIPETTWNGTCASQMVRSFNEVGTETVSYGKSGFCNQPDGSGFVQLAGGEGGPSGCFTGSPTIYGVVSGTCKPQKKPSWQKGVLGIPADGVRDIPDVAMFASNGVWNVNLATCFTDPNRGGAPCTGNPVTWAANAGGTSYATPIMAAIQAVIDQALGGAYVGNAAPVYYQLAAKEYGTKGSAGCSAEKGKAIGASCIFHDVDSGDVVMDCVANAGKLYNCYRPSGTYGVLSTSNTSFKAAYSAGVGYDLATGLGSINATNLFNSWP